MAKICKICSEKFETLYSTLEVTCRKVECRAKWAISVMEKQRDAQQKKAKQDWDKEKIAIKEKLMTLTDWQKLLEKPINKICCLIDKGSGCISCKGHTTPQAGHYHTVKSNGSIRFNLNNLHLQDFNCNCKKGANIHHYDLGLIERYGKQYWEYVKFEIVAEYPILKMHKFEYQDKINKANSIVKWLLLQDKRYSPKERLELRDKFNKEIGIYKN